MSKIKAKIKKRTITTVLISLFYFRYNVCFMILTYFLPIVMLILIYSTIGVELWGAVPPIGEPTQDSTIRSQRKKVKFVKAKMTKR